MADKTQKPRERRDRTEEILQIATRKFSEKGYRGTSLASIASEVGLTEPGLLHYFPSKVKLLQGVLEYKDNEEKERYIPMVNLDTPDFSRMMEVIKQLVADNEQKPALVQLFTVLVAESIRPNHPSHEYFVERYSIARKTYSEAFRQLQDDGLIRTDVDPDQIASMLIAMLDGLQIQWLLDPDNFSMTVPFNLYIQLMSDYLT